MRRNLLGCALSCVLLMLFLWAIPASAQEHYTEGHVWRVTLIRVKPNQMDAYMTSLRQSTKRIYDEEKREGNVLDYKVFLKETRNSPEDWDICIAVEYKNHAALDGGAATTLDGVISTRRTNGAGWKTRFANTAAPVTPFGLWQMTLPNTATVRGWFTSQQITDILFVITYAGNTPAWPS